MGQKARNSAGPGKRAAASRGELGGCASQLVAIPAHFSYQPASERRRVGYGLSTTHLRAPLAELDSNLCARGARSQRWPLPNYAPAPAHILSGELRYVCYMYTPAGAARRSGTKRTIQRNGPVHGQLFGPVRFDCGLCFGKPSPLPPRTEQAATSKPLSRSELRAPSTGVRQRVGGGYSVFFKFNGNLKLFFSF